MRRIAMKKSHHLHVSEYATLDQGIRCPLARNFLLHNAPTRDTDFIIVAGGDGTMLKVIRKYWDLSNTATGKPIFFGLNYGTKGFLLNQPTVSVIRELERGLVEIHDANLLQAEMEFQDGRKAIDFAFNDFYFRAPEGTARIRVAIDGEIVRQKLVCDGIISATGFGSTAYNASAGGPVIAFGTRNQMTLTAIAPSIDSNWRNMAFAAPSFVTLELLETGRNPVNFYADGVVYHDVQKVIVRISDKNVRLAFVQSQKIRQRHLRMQLIPENGGA
jgi:NAD+ kinase